MGPSARDDRTAIVGALERHPWLASITLGFAACGTSLVLFFTPIVLFLRNRPAFLNLPPLVDDILWYGAFLPVPLALLVPSIAQVLGYPHLRVSGVLLGAVVAVVVTSALL